MWDPQISAGNIITLIGAAIGAVLTYAGIKASISELAKDVAETKADIKEIKKDYLRTDLEEARSSKLKMQLEYIEKRIGHLEKK